MVLECFAPPQTGDLDIHWEKSCVTLILKSFTVNKHISLTISNNSCVKNLETIEKIICMTFERIFIFYLVKKKKYQCAQRHSMVCLRNTEKQFLAKCFNSFIFSVHEKFIFKVQDCLHKYCMILSNYLIFYWKAVKNLSYAWFLLNDFCCFFLDFFFIKDLFFWTYIQWNSV